MPNGHELRSLLLCSGLVLSLAGGLLACAPTHGEDGVGADDQDLSTAPALTPDQVVRAYYAATRAERPAEALTPIIADGAILSAPSVRMLKRVPHVEGKEAFVKAIDGASFLLGQATVLDVFVQTPNLAISRIDLPLPNGDTITQVEFFTLENGRITRLDSYYDSLRFAAALPAIALDRLKHALGL